MRVSLLVVAGVLSLAQSASASIPGLMKMARDSACRPSTGPRSIVPVNPRIVVGGEAVQRGHLRAVTDAGRQLPLRVSSDEVVALDHGNSRADPVIVIVSASDKTLFRLERYQEDTQRWCRYGDRYKVSSTWATNDRAVRIRAARRVAYPVESSPGDYQPQIELDIVKPETAEGVRIEWATTWRQLDAGYGTVFVRNEAGASTRFVLNEDWTAWGGLHRADVPADVVEVFVRLTPLYADGTEGHAWAGWVRRPSNPKPTRATERRRKGSALQTGSTTGGSQPSPVYKIIVTS